MLLMDRITRFVDCFLPLEACNLRCHYCYITHKRKFNNKIQQMPHSPEFIRQAFSRERWGGRMLINLCAGGETLLCESLVQIVKELLLEGHYVMIVTNGTINKRLAELSLIEPELLNHLFFNN